MRRKVPVRVREIFHDWKCVFWRSFFESNLRFYASSFLRQVIKDWAWGNAYGGKVDIDGLDGAGR